MTNRIISVGDSFTLPAAVNVADANLPTASKAATIGGKIAKGDLFTVVTDAPYNADRTGVADATTALNDAAAAALAKGPNARLFIPAGNYRISGTVTVSCGLDASQATFEYYGTGRALHLGLPTSAVTPRQVFFAPRVINMNRTTGWDGTSEGIRLSNLNTCEVHIPFVQDFERGLVIYGLSGGSAYNTIHLGALWENHQNLVFDMDSTGYANQNTIVGGRLQQSTTKGATLGDTNAYQVDLRGSFGGGANNNTFLGMSMEGDNVAYYRVYMSGTNNVFYNCRWEAPGGVYPRVRYTTTAASNKIDGGYNSAGIVEVFDGTSGGGEIRDGAGGYTSASNTGAQVIPNNTYTTITTWNTPVQRRISYDSGLGEFTPRPGRWLIRANVTFARNATGRRIITIYGAGGTLDVVELPGTAERSTLKASAIFRFNGTQTFKIQAWQTSGADLALEGSSGYVAIQAEYLGC